MAPRPLPAIPGSAGLVLGKPERPATAWWNFFDRLRDQVRTLPLRDTRANQPLASDVYAGTLYYVTDEAVTEQSDGAAWVTYTDAGAGTVTNSGALTDHALIVGNGGADVSALGSLGTATTVLHGNAAGDPSFSAVDLAADVSGVLPTANGGTPLFLASRVLTNADLKALPTTPLTFGPNPGAGFYLSAVRGWFRLNSLAGAYTNVNADAWVNVHTLDWQVDTLSYLLNGNGTGNTRCSDLFAVAVKGTWNILPFASGSGADGLQFAADWGFGTGLVDRVAAENQPFELYFDNNGAGNLTGGNAANGAEVIVLYKLLAV